MIPKRPGTTPRRDAPAFSTPAFALAGTGRAARAFARSWARRGRPNRLRRSSVIRRSSRPAELAGVPAVSVARAGSEPGTNSCDVLDPRRLRRRHRERGVGACPPRLLPRRPCTSRGRSRARCSSPWPAGERPSARSTPSGRSRGRTARTGAAPSSPSRATREAAEAATAIARAVGARPHGLSPDAKPLYHAAASLAAGGAAAVVSVAVEAWIAAGVPEETAREVLSGLAERAVAAAGKRPFHEAFTGAVARRDVGTVRAAHRSALAASRSLRALSRAGGGDPASDAGPREGRRDPGSSRRAASARPRDGVPVTALRVLQFRSSSPCSRSRAARSGSQSHGVFQLRHDADGGQGRLLRPRPVREDDQPPPHLRPDRARAPAARWSRSRRRPTGRSSSTSCRSTSA